jgi:hypothetical protein
MERQRTCPRTLAAFFLTHPNRISRLIAFAKRIAHARENLTRAIVDVVRGFEQ